MREHGTYVCYRFGPDGGSDSTLGCHCTACSLAARAPWPGPVPWLPPVTLHDACVAYAEACDAYEAAAARSAAARRAGERGWQRLNTCAMEAHARMDAALRALGAVAREAVLGS